METIRIKVVEIAFTIFSCFLFINSLTGCYTKENKMIAVVSDLLSKRKEDLEYFNNEIKKWKSKDSAVKVIINNRTNEIEISPKQIIDKLTRDLLTQFMIDNDVSCIIRSENGYIKYIFRNRNSNFHYYTLRSYESPNFKEIDTMNLRVLWSQNNWYLYESIRPR
jgi:hypothetical protein